MLLSGVVVRLRRILLLLGDDEAHLVRVGYIINNAHHILVSGVSVEEDHLEFLVHDVALFVSDQIDILLILNYLHVSVVLTPFVKFCDLFHRQDLWVGPIIVEVKIEIVTVYGKYVTNSH